MKRPAFNKKETQLLIENDEEFEGNWKKSEKEIGSSMKKSVDCMKAINRLKSRANQGEWTPELDNQLIKF